MQNNENISQYYREAVAGLDEKILNDNELWYNYVLNLPKHLQIVYTIVVLHQQIFNGGLHQYFFNSYGQFAYLTAENLRLVKANNTALILEKAITYVNADGDTVDVFRKKNYTRELRSIIEFDNELFSRLDDLDNKYDLLDEDLNQLTLEYIRSA